ncbi:unnamed protein product [Alopecurus aequalis]
MAAGRRPNRLFVVANSELGNLVFSLHLKHLFFSHKEKSQTSSQEEHEPPRLLSLPAPLACFKQVDELCEYMAFAASPDGHVIAAVGYEGQTQIYAAAVSPGPDMHSAMNHPVLLPVGDRMFFAISAYPRLDLYKGRPHFEVLQQLPRTGRWAWTAVTDPPGRRFRENVGAYFVSGARVYVSLQRQGTYSYHTARRRWRREGDWELPVLGQAILVPNFLGTGRRLLFGFHDMLGPGENFPLCAVDMDARPPVVVETWPKAERFSHSQVWSAGYGMSPRVSQLNHFGGGRFCISVTYTSSDRERKPRRVLCFMAVELTQELQLLKRQYSCYVIPESPTSAIPADVLSS